MNSTNRMANRLLILVVGLILLVGGVSVAAAALIPAAGSFWRDVGATLNRQVLSWLQQTPLGSTGVSWILPAVLLLLLILIVLLVMFVFRQGRGHTGTVVQDSASTGGGTLVDTAVAEQTIQDAIGSQPEFLTTRVSAYRVRRVPVLKISVTCRRGVSPRDAATIVEDALRAFDVLLGREIPALVQISGGFRARVTSSTRLQ